MKPSNNSADEDSRDADFGLMVCKHLRQKGTGGMLLVGERNGEPFYILAGGSLECLEAIGDLTTMITQEGVNKLPTPKTIQ